MQAVAADSGSSRKSVENHFDLLEDLDVLIDGVREERELHWIPDVIIGLKPSVFIDDQRDPGEAEMEVGRPARVDAEHLHDVEPHRIGQGQVLVREPAQQADSTGMFLGTNGNDLQWVQILDERGELQRAGPIERPEEPAVAFGEHEHRRHQRGRIGKQPAEHRVVGIGLIEERNSAPTCLRTREAAV